MKEPRTLQELCTCVFFTVLMFAIIRQCILCSVSSSYRAFSLSFNNLQVHVCYRYPKDVNEDVLKRKKNKNNFAFSFNLANFRPQYIVNNGCH